MAKRHCKKEVHRTSSTKRYIYTYSLYVHMFNLTEMSFSQQQEGQLLIAIDLPLYL